MRRLHHHTLSPSSRTVRLALGEKRLDCALVEEREWEWNESFLTLNPAGEVPVLVEAEDRVVAEAAAILEWLDEVHPDPPLIGETPEERAEARRLHGWFDRKFRREVGDLVVAEKLLKRMLPGGGTPDSRAVRAARHNVHTHLAYVGWLAERRVWLAGDRLTIADLAAAAHLSLVDYAGDVPWEDHPEAKTWYARVKSRPSFRPLLAEQVPGIPPPRHYADLDF